MAPQKPSPVLRFDDALHVREGRRRLLYFGGCDYHRLSWHREVRSALVRGLRQDGLNTAASRNTTGNHTLYGMLESALAAYFGSESAVLLSSGYAANSAAAQALAGQFSHAFIDRQAHASLRDAAPFLGANIIPFQHHSPKDLAKEFRRHRRPRRAILLTDGLFAQDGSAAPIREYLEMLPHSAWILVDDAHGAGVLGQSGRGILEWSGVSRDRVIQIITLSKAFGAYGGAVLGPAWLRDKVVCQSPWFSGNTPLPLPLAHAALAATRLLTRQRGRLDRLREHTRLLREALFDTQDPRQQFPGPILSWRCSSRNQTSRLQAALREAGIFPIFIQYPGGPPEGHFRFAISSAHSSTHVEALLHVLQKHGGANGPGKASVLGQPFLRLL